MGEALGPQITDGLFDELDKIGSAFYEAAGRLGSPLKSLAKGWKLMSPAHALQESGPIRDRLIEEIGGQFSPAKGPVRGFLRRNFAAGTHLMEPATPVRGQGLRGAAEELSRRGWTGEGRLTKYVPLGERMQVPLGLGSTALDVGHGMTHSQEGSPGSWERAAKGLAMTGTGVGLHGIGGPGSTLLWFTAPAVAGAIAGRGGRVIDRLTHRDQA